MSRWRGLPLHVVKTIALFFSILFLLAAASSPPATLTAPTPNDNHINKQVKIRLVLDNSIHLLKITATTKDGVVALQGVTEAKTQAIRAVEIASSTSGVIKVDASQLFVKDSSQPLQDTYITAQIKGLFWRNNLRKATVGLPWFKLSVETQNGVVYLSGAVASKVQKDLVTSLAQSVEGVLRVDASALEIKKS